MSKRKQVSSTKIKKCHSWDTYEVLNARCPYCGANNLTEYGDFMEGSAVLCNECKKTYLLGKQNV